MLPRISVAMATRNGARFIHEQLSSIATQSLRPDEIVICDDQSTDGTLEVVSEFSRNCTIPMTVEVNPAALGVTKNFEKALLRCSGDILFLSDQDDRWLPEKIARVMDEFDRDTSLMVVTNDQIIGNADLSVLGPRKTENMAKLGIDAIQMCTGCCTAVRREFLELAIPFCSDWSHDNWIGNLARMLNVKKFINQPLQLYRRHGGNVSQWLASRPRPIRRFDRLEWKSSSEMASAWEHRLAISTWMTARLLERETWLARHHLTRQAADALRELAARQRDYERRLDIAMSPFPRRLKLVWRCLVEGGYARFGGIRSMLADLGRSA